MLKKELIEKTKDAESAFDLLLSSIASVNGTIMSLASEEFSKGNLEKTQQYNEQSTNLIKFTRNILDLKNNWENLFGKNIEATKVDNPLCTPSKTIAPVPSIAPPSLKKDGYKYTNSDITMEFVSSAGGSYYLKIPKTVFKEVSTYAVKYIQKNEYIQAKDIVAELNQYLLSNTNYKDIKPIASKTLKFLVDRGLLKYRNGRTGYYELSGTADDVFAFLDKFDKPT